MLTEVAAITDYQPTINKRRRNDFDSANADHTGAVAKQGASVPPRLAYVSNSQPPAPSAHMPPEFTAPAAAMNDWDLTNLLLAQMNYMQANSAYPYQQQLDTGHHVPTPTPIPGQREHPQDISGIYNNGNGLPAATQSQAPDDPFAIWWDIPSSFTRCPPISFLRHLAEY
jgi:hypothetical protein